MSSIEFQFGSDTNTRLFTDWLSDVGKDFSVSDCGLAVVVDPHLIDEDVVRHATDLGVV